MSALIQRIAEERQMRETALIASMPKTNYPELLDAGRMMPSLGDDGKFIPLGQTDTVLLSSLGAVASGGASPSALPESKPFEKYDSLDVYGLGAAL